MVKDNTWSSEDEMWASTTFEGSRREQLQQWGKMTFTQKIEWLEEAHKLALQFEKNRVAPRSGVSRTNNPTGA